MTNVPNLAVLTDLLTLVLEDCLPTELSSVTPTFLTPSMVEGFVDAFVDDPEDTRDPVTAAQKEWLLLSPPQKVFVLQGWIQFWIEASDQEKKEASARAGRRFS